MRDVNHASNSIRSRSSYAHRLKKILTYLYLENMIVILSLENDEEKLSFSFLWKKSIEIVYLSFFFYSYSMIPTKYYTI